ncbi:MAG: hypothetical protein QXK27_03270 [Candidatus Hadarchaeales archaeon]
MSKLATRMEARARTGAETKAFRWAPRGMTVSLKISLKKSAKGWKIGGPTLHCTLATTFLMTHTRKSPKHAANRRPGKNRALRRKRAVIPSRMGREIRRGGAAPPA